MDQQQRLTGSRFPIRDTVTMQIEILEVALAIGHVNEATERVPAPTGTEGSTGAE